MEDPSVLSAPPSLVKFLAKYQLPLVLGCVSLLLIAVSLTLLFKSADSNSPIEFSTENSEASAEASLTHQVTIDVEGAVAKPGVYRLPDGSRVEEAITAAGGLSDKADLDKISLTLNRAAKVVDGGKLYFPEVGENPGGVAGAAVDTATTKVSINTATEAQLDTLSGVGPVTAGKIISNRPYQLLEELVTKKVLSQSLFEKIKDQLSL